MEGGEFGRKAMKIYPRPATNDPWVNPHHFEAVDDSALVKGFDFLFFATLFDEVYPARFEPREKPLTSKQ